MPFNFTYFPDQKYYVDIVFCVDATEKGGPLIEEIKKTTRSFAEIIADAFSERGREIDTLRVRFVVTRGLNDDAEDGICALCESKFFTLPDEKKEFLAFADSIEARGGKAEPESALEALAEAMNSDWTDQGGRRRHVIVLFTRADAAMPEDGNRDEIQRPANMPAKLAELEDWWTNGTPNGKLQERAKRLILFAPTKKQPWDRLQDWYQTILYNIEDIVCLQDTIMETIPFMGC